MPVNAEVEALLARLAEVGDQLAVVEDKRLKLLEDRKALVDAIYAASPPRQAPVTRMQMALHLTSREAVQKIKAGQAAARLRQRTQRAG